MKSTDISLDRQASSASVYILKHIIYCHFYQQGKQNCSSKKQKEIVTDIIRERHILYLVLTWVILLL